jgi:hypothetical protein
VSYTLGDIVPLVFDGDHLGADFEGLLADPATAPDHDVLHVFLDELAGSEDALWKLIKWKGENATSPFFNCAAIDCFQTAGYNLYRIRPLHSRLSKYRILYAYDNVNTEFHLLAVVIKRPNTPPKVHDPRHYDYEEDHPISERVRNEYDKLGLKRLG